ncbi:MAG: 4-demethylwyosine synthase TYW1 [Candidatus Aenigmatarchaeota archaeon]
MLPEKKKQELEERQYRFVGNHSAVRTCNWLKESLRCDDVCYKQKFYGIESHRCLQMTPALLCNQRCRHCWRDTSFFSSEWKGHVDDPEEIIDGCIEAQRELLSGFGGNEDVPEEKLEEAKHPNQAAISLTGEPMFYPKISELIEEFHRRDFSTFLVTNGTFPERIEKLKELPTNFYVSVEAPNKELYRKHCNPVEEENWSKLQETLELVGEMDSTTVLRITCMDGVNMHLAEEFAELVEEVGFDFIEAKAYMHIGYSQKRMPRDAMPSHEDVKKFSEEVAGSSKYNVADEQKRSRVVLLEK